MRALILALLLAGCGTTDSLVMPPPEYDRPFSGQVIEHQWHNRPFGAWSMALHPKGEACDIWIAADADAETHAKLLRIERANCNGWSAHGGDRNLRRLSVWR